jgi:glycosyltransferase involved in cell wall biosynthesis
MKFSVLINNHNYGRYLVECVESALAQNFPAYEIIVVDDGSSDDSLALARRQFSSRPEVRIIAQENQGQAMAIGVGMEAATGEVICLLDADDLYRPDYLATLRELYQQRREVDLVFCRAAAESGEVANMLWLDPQRDYDYGYTALISYFGYLRWLGNNTSTISMRGRLARALRFREAAGQIYGTHAGDFALLHGASLLGARKYYLHRELVAYRLHDKNHSVYDRRRADQRHARALLEQRWINYYRNRSALSDDMHVFLEDEMNSAPEPLPQHLELYRAAMVREARLHPEADLPTAGMPLGYRIKSVWKRLRRKLLS